MNYRMLIFIFLILLQANLGDGYAKKEIKKLCEKVLRKFAPGGKPDKKARKGSQQKTNYVQPSAARIPRNAGPGGPGGPGGSGGPGFSLQENPFQHPSDYALPPHLGGPAPVDGRGPPDKKPAEASERQPWHEETLVKGSQTNRTNLSAD